MLVADPAGRLLDSRFRSPRPMIVLGIDLSGPVNAAETVAVLFRREKGGLVLLELVQEATDDRIYDLVGRLPRQERVAVGLDAPLSCNPGGGDRPADRELRRNCIAAGLRPGSVMTPTMSRMVYLTLRGMGLARGLESLGGPQLEIVEVHPGGAMALGGAEVGEVRAFKHHMEARRRLLGWLEEQGLAGTGSLVDPSDHVVAACGCALAAWKWVEGRPTWRWPALPPHHPYDFAC